MSILIDENTRVVVQGITGRDGGFHTGQMLEYGTKIVAGVTPGRGGQVAQGVPVYNSVKEAVAATGANTSCIFVPAKLNAADAIVEAIYAGIKLVVCITENVPNMDMIRVNAIVDAHPGTRLIGPNCPGLISPLTYEIADELTRAGFGQTSAVGIGGDPMIGTTFKDVLPLFEADPDTQVIVMVGEIGGSDEEEGAAVISASITKPVVGFIGGRTAPPGKRMGHAGAIISGKTGTPQGKVAALEAAGVPVADTPHDVAALVQAAFAKLRGNH
ncbi:MAG: succinate--CoA ligase subunit alpha [Armatimonadetes bacterium]|nr:succinate--CoA ligase subunit alpha [Armatimonadota bacterium]